MAENFEEYSDSRFAELDAQKQTQQQAVNTVYEQTLAQADEAYQKQTDAVKAYEEEQKAFTQEQTDFAVDQIEQQKEQAQKDYTKEQSAAYTDYQKQSGDYGVNAEAMAAGGMTGTGYSESSRVSMYNTYQNRVATAREVYNQAVRDYDNAIRQAQALNNSTLAEIAYQSLQTQLSLSLESLQYKNQLQLDQLDRNTAIDKLYYNRTLDVQDQINTENALAELQNSGSTLNYQDTGGSLGKVHYYRKINGTQRELSEAEYSDWENRFEEASTGEAMKKLIFEMLDGGIHEDTVEELYEKYKWKFDFNDGNPNAGGNSKGGGGVGTNRVHMMK